jgi:hypothetical protein
METALPRCRDRPRPRGQSVSEKHKPPRVHARARYLAIGVARRLSARSSTISDAGSIPSPDAAPSEPGNTPISAMIQSSWPCPRQKATAQSVIGRGAATRALGPTTGPSSPTPVTAEGSGQTQPGNLESRQEGAPQGFQHRSSDSRARLVPIPADHNAEGSFGLVVLRALNSRAPAAIRRR